MLCNIEAEQTLIGLAISDQECAELLAQLPENTFTDPETVTLFRIIREIIKEHGTPNMVSIANRIPHNAKSVMECSRKCVNLAISPTMYKQIETELLDFRKRRMMMAVCEKVVNKASDPLIDVDTMAGELTAMINDTGNKAQSVNIQDVVVEFIEGLGNQEEMISTGIAGLDRIAGGLQNGMLAILGARPKVGKTALGLSIAMHVAEKTGPVLIVSLEMKPKEIMQRMMAAESGVDMKKIVTHRLDDQDLVEMSKHYEYVSTLPIRFAMTPTPLQIRREASAMQRNGGLAMIMVDYLQLMRSDESRKSRYEEVSSISRELKLMAMDLNVPILALTQFNRDSEQGGVRRKPTMSEARDSGSIEQDANIFLIQYPPMEPKPGTDAFEYWASCQMDGTEFQLLEIAANRQGPTGIVPLKFDKSHMRFMTMRRE